MKGDRERCLEAGMDGYISKPVQSKVLYETIESIMTAGSLVPVSLQPQAPTADALVVRQAVNLDEILDRLGGNVGLLQSIVSLFEEDSPGQMARIQDAIRARDAGALTVAAHTLKGSLLALSADRASAAALELEKMGRESRLNGAAECLAKLETEVVAVGSELQKIVKERLSEPVRS
jgi:HPt (histidine-containing phosphotransfer) domain-containing protein